MNSLEIRPVNDECVDFALSANDYLLDSGMEPNVIRILDSAPLTPEPEFSSPFIWELDAQQMAKFKSDYEQPTPTAPRLRPRLSRLAILHIAAATTLGDPYALSHQGNGNVIIDLLPWDNTKNQANSEFGSKRKFAFHTDQSYNDDRSQVPDNVVLACIRNEEDAVNTVVDMNQVLEFLSDYTIEILKKRDFDFFKSPSQESQVGAILSLENDALTTRFSPTTVGRSKKAILALRSFGDAVMAVSQKVTLKPGQMLVLPNKRALHARMAFKPHKNPGRRRWLQRIFVQDHIPYLDEEA